MLIEHQHQHQPGVFDPATAATAPARATCWTTTTTSSQEQILRQAHRWARQARRHAIWALWSSGAGILFGVVALLAG